MPNFRSLDGLHRLATNFKKFLEKIPGCFPLMAFMVPGQLVLTKEPSGLARRDGKRPDGLTLIPFQGGKPLVWDVTVTTLLAESYVDTAAIRAGLVAD